MTFEESVRGQIAANASNEPLQAAARAFMTTSIEARYSYNFSCLGRPIIQYPQDMVAMQELIWATRPDLIIETGIAHGGSLVLSASMLALLDYGDALAAGRMLDPARPGRTVLGVDIDIRAHNRAAIEAHPLANRIRMIEGSSVDPAVVALVAEAARGCQRVLVCLDSNHTHDHVLGELRAYAPLTTPGSYCCVFDSVVEDLPEGMFPDRPWGKGNNPKSAVHAYLRELAGGGTRAADGAPLRFEIDHAIDNKLLISVAPDGYLKRLAA